MVLSTPPSPRFQAQDDDRFYCPPPRRHLRAAAAAAAAAKEAAEEVLKAQAAAKESNLERFVASTSLLVPRTSISTRHRTNCQIESTPPPFFNLTDLWDSFKEWSAYGAGVPLLLHGTDSVVQYYVPFLSAIQLFLQNPHSTLTSRRLPREESDEDSCQEETSSDSENEGLVVVERERTEEMPSCTHRAAETEVDGGFSSDDSNSNGGRHQLPVFQFFEHDPPYARQPLADKIWTLAAKFPELKMYRSCDLLPSSWISVAWYPIYRIPTGPTLQDLDACFLTFHSLSTVQGDGIMHEEITVPSASIMRQNPSDNPDKLTLPLLGLASYKFKESIWISNGPHERELVTNLMHSADEWLCSRQVNHPDYRFFLSHYSTAL
ncbi:hypothetical protein LUZ61_000065 [Rhynchospora tenuis]|uniref:Uncharacterized protein n=1 Tax=Rhynchospora tenuis TaxID=198213 RepID=A0AAD5ZEK2_9POAL|nr:hypothetical protein LUZ61_000065 [Rhynchospora tenuis]